jgi:aminoglycoside phosphotransferase (APT) family kinase protein
MGAAAEAGDRLERLLDEPLAAFALAMPLDDGWRQRIDATRAILEPLRSAPLPDVIEHGDVSHPNLLVTPDGAIAAVDWELGEPHGLPAHDLCGFLGYIAAASAGATAPERQGAAITGAMGERGGWMDLAARDYARRIHLDPSFLPALTIASWARRAVGLVERLHDGRPRAVSPETASWLGGHRYVTAWDAALAAEARA